MDLELLLDNVLPSTGVLFKHCPGAWEFFKSDIDFEEGKGYMSQKCDESFHTFIERVVQQLMKDEEGDEEPLVSIDYAIYSNYKER